MTEANTFTNLGRAFQEKVLVAMMQDQVWATHFIEVFDVDQCFEFAHLKLLSSLYIDHFLKRRVFPSRELLIDMVKDKLTNNNDTTLKEHIIAFIQRVDSNKDLGDLSWVKEKAFSFCRQQRMKKALLESIDLISSDQYDSVVNVIKGAISDGIPQSIGMYYTSGQDIDARYSKVDRNTVLTGIPEIDDRRILNGGLGAGELGVVCAPTSVGKSQLLVMLGANALRKKKNVVHYTLEMSERLVGVRYDSNICDISSTDCYQMKDSIKQWFETHEKDVGQLFIKEYPTRSITVNNIQMHLEKLAYDQFKPDLVIVDYASIMRSTEKHTEMRHGLSAIIQELRGLAQEHQVPVWTALQSNKEGARSDYIDVTNMAESYGQAAEADFVLGLQRKPEHKATGFGSLYIAKNRNGMDGLNFKIHLDTSKSKLRILSEEEASDFEKMSAPSPEQQAEEIRCKARSFATVLRDNKDLFKPVGGQHDYKRH